MPISNKFPTTHLPIARLKTDKQAVIDQIPQNFQLQQTPRLQQ